MPAPSSLPIDPAIGHLAGLAEGAEDSPGLLAVLAKVADPRNRRGVRQLTVTQASSGQLAAIIRGHWAIEDGLHWVRDIDFDEDRSQVRTGNGPRVMASLRNLAITILRLARETSIAAASSYRARRPSRPLPAIMSAGFAEALKGCCWQDGRCPARAVRRPARRRRVCQGQ
jgi:hypothetical protein